ncbi:peptidoglycan-associated lipoprotein Pal [Candidatus Palibaumannia cicadellinicola]|uniref:Peptidoglycan-associated lipoprotein n=1 Tax=Candidatus Palibaumannia cicadellinicola TaxID=186490 RepID=A0A0K2BJV6_9GAMM|nr:peptidoglycan-associated lipoprotein Pal [Candidatus Baumannia cicadellinicola]AKZ65701.1 18K peptidoglycan-associated outer membrane lipoprotein [Candidatus Baumannia cicadellinicola]
MQNSKLLLTGIIVSFSIMSIAGCSEQNKSQKNGKSYLQMNSPIEETGLKSNSNSSSTKSSDEHAALQKLRQTNIIYFDLDKYDIHLNYGTILDDHAKFLRNNPSKKVIIEGHTDERGTPEYNIALGERRANAVKMYLQSKGVFDEQMMILSYGKEKPVVFGHNETAYGKNRRAVLVYSDLDNE